MANGINYLNNRLVVNEPTFGYVNVYDYDLKDPPSHLKTVKLPMIADNVNFDNDGSMLVGGWMGPLWNSIRKRHDMMSNVVKIDGDSLEPVETLFHDLSGEYSVSTAILYGDEAWFGSPTRPALYCKI